MHVLLCVWTRRLQKTLSTKVGTLRKRKASPESTSMYEIYINHILKKRIRFIGMWSSVVSVYPDGNKANVSVCRIKTSRLILPSAVRNSWGDTSACQPIKLKGKGKTKRKMDWFSEVFGLWLSYSHTQIKDTENEKWVPHALFTNKILIIKFEHYLYII